MTTHDYDFIGFTYGGKHSIDDFGIYRTSDGNRYNDNLIPPLTDKTADVPGGNGQYYFSSYYKSRQFSIPIAFDGLTEVQYQQVRKWLDGKEIKELIFDESPYKVYSAKVTGTPQLKTICFDEGGERIYKGEGTIQFTCYYPFARTPNLTKSGEDGRSIDSYLKDDYPTKEQWQLASGLTEHKDGDNPGDLEAPFVVKTKVGLTIKANERLKVGNLEVTILEEAKNLVWDSKTGLITGEINEATRAIRTSGRSYGTIPIGGVSPKEIAYYTTNTAGGEVVYYIDKTRTGMAPTVVPQTQMPFSIEYNYWYF